MQHLRQKVLRFDESRKNMPEECASFVQVFILPSYSPGDSHPLWAGRRE